IPAVAVPPLPARRAPASTTGARARNLSRPVGCLGGVSPFRAPGGLVAGRSLLDRARADHRPRERNQTAQGEETWRFRRAVPPCAATLRPTTRAGSGEAAFSLSRPRGISMELRADRAVGGPIAAPARG